MNGQQSYVLRTSCYRKRNETLRPMWRPALADRIASGGDNGHLAIIGRCPIPVGLHPPRRDRLALRPRLGHFHAPALPLRRRLRPGRGDACDAGRHGCHHTAIEEVILAAGVELPLVDGPAAGGDGDRLLAREVIEEHVVFALVEGDCAGIADRGIQPGGEEALPVVRVEQQPALAADGADLPAGADPLAGLLLAVVNGAGRRADTAAVTRENDGGRGVPAAELTNRLRGLPPLGVDHKLLDTGDRAILPRPFAAEEHVDERRESRLERGLETAGVEVG